MNQLTLTLKPRWENGTVADMTVFASLPAALIPQGPAKPALQYPALAYGGRCPFAEYEIVSISDENGSVRCHLDDIPCFYDSADCKGIFLERPVSGTPGLGYASVDHPALPARSSRRLPKQPLF